MKSRLGLAALLLSAAVVHFAVPKVYEGTIPRQIPGYRRAWVYASGVGEAALGVGMMVPATRRLAALGAAAFFVAVFPANVHSVSTVRTPRARRILIARLPLQLPLVMWALSVAKKS